MNRVTDLFAEGFTDSSLESTNYHFLVAGREFVLDPASLSRTELRAKLDQIIEAELRPAIYRRFFSSGDVEKFCFESSKLREASEASYEAGLQDGLKKAGNQ